MIETIALGAVKRLRFLVFDPETEEPADPSGWSLTVTNSAGSTNPTITHVEVGVFDADYVTVITGPHAAVFATTGVLANTVVNLFVVTGDIYSMATITATQIRTYLGGSSESDVVLLEALAAERVDQANKCRIDNYTESLREALLRRVARNLAARRVPVATFTSFDGGATSTRVPQVDPEIKRLEGPYRRTPVG